MSNQRNLLEKIKIRIAESSDGAALWNLKRELHLETEFLRLSPQEKEETENDETNKIYKNASEHRLTLVAYLDTEIVGYLSALTDVNKSTIIQVTLGVLQKNAGFGIGKSLIEKMEQWARDSKIIRIELKVMTHNISALRLYEGLGYKIINENNKNSFVLYESEKIVQEYCLEKRI